MLQEILAEKRKTSDKHVQKQKDLSVQQELDELQKQLTPQETNKLLNKEPSIGDNGIVAY